MFGSVGCGDEIPCVWVVCAKFVSALKTGRISRGRAFCRSAVFLDVCFVFCVACAMNLWIWCEHIAGNSRCGVFMGVTQAFLCGRYNDFVTSWTFCFLCGRCSVLAMFCSLDAQE